MTGHPSTAGSPSISVVITAFRRHQFLLEAVRSVLASRVGRDSYEVVVVADRLSPELAQQLSELGVRTFFSDTPFVGETLATGIAEARGEVVAFCDDDDRFHADKLGVLLEAFSDPNVIYFHHGFRRVDGGSTPVPARTEIAPIRARLDIPLTRGDLGWVRRKGGFLNMSSIAVRRSSLLPRLDTLRKVTNAQDFTMLLLLDGPGHAVFDGARILVDYRTHLSQGTHPFHGDYISPEHEQFITGTARSFEVLQQSAPTMSARRFARCRKDSYVTLEWALTGNLILRDQRIGMLAARSILGNLREMDLFGALVLTSLMSVSAFSHHWTRQYYTSLKRSEQVGLGFMHEPASPPAALAS